MSLIHGRLLEVGDGLPSVASSTPDLDGWGWDSYWSIRDWMQWHAAMKTAYGLAEANRRFLAEWEKQTLGANPLDARSFNTEFRDYAKANGFLSGLYYGAGVLAQPIGTVVDVVDATTGAVSNAAGTLKTVGGGLITLALLLVGASYLLPHLSGLSSLKRKRS